MYITLPETNSLPENQWLEDESFLLGFGLFSGANLLLVSGSVYFNITHRIHVTGIFTYIYHTNQPNAGNHTIHVKVSDIGHQMSPASKSSSWSPPLRVKA